MTDDLTVNSSSTETGAEKAGKTSRLFEQNARSASFGPRADLSFYQMLSEALSGRRRAAVDPGGTVNPNPPSDPMLGLVSLGALNAAAFLNVGHFTGDSYLLKSSLDAGREERAEKGVEPIQETDGQMDG